MDNMPNRAKNKKIRYLLPEMVKQYLDEQNLKCAWIRSSDIGRRYNLGVRGECAAIHLGLKTLLKKQDHTLPILVKEMHEIKMTHQRAKRYHFLVERVGDTLSE